MSQTHGLVQNCEQEGKQDSAAKRGKTLRENVSAASKPEATAARGDMDEAADHEDEQQSELSSDEEDDSDSESQDDDGSGPAVSDRAIGVQVKRARQSSKSKRARVFHACEPCRESGPVASSASLL
jgi:hypothetical protein